jgi:N-dimethylarginine dimethylaminohydrolase
VLPGQSVHRTATSRSTARASPRMLHVDDVVELVSEQLVTAHSGCLRRHRQTSSCRPAH